jgi:iron complex outermembrane recepter protein
VRLHEFRIALLKRAVHGLSGEVPSFRSQAALEGVAPYLFLTEGLLIGDKPLFFPMRSSQWVTTTRISLLRGGGSLMRLSVVAACLSLCLIGFSSAQDAHASIRKETNIPAEGLGPALNALAKDRNFQIVYVTEEIANVRTEGAVGEFTTEEALKRLLTGTGLTYRYLDDKTVTIGSATAPQLRGARSKAESSGSSEDSNANQEGKKSSSGGFRVAQVDQGKGSSATSVGNQTSNSKENSSGPSTGLAEIIVTAQKREERLQEVPVPVTVVSARALLDSNQVKLQDYYTQIPGLSITIAPQSQILSIRGITTGDATFSRPTVGITIDDIPYGSAVGQTVPDFDPGDLARIEVLRGPQGTLYGASSMGGLLKFVTVDPSTEGLSGRVEAGTSSVHNGAELGYTFRGSVNLPLSDTLAIRASAFTRQDPGYIDNPILRIDGINKDHASGAYLAALWRPSDTVSVKLSALFQETKSDGTSDVTPMPGLGDLQQNFIAGVGSYDRKVQAYSMVLKDKFGNFNLEALSGFSANSISDSWDFSSTIGGLNQFLFGVPGSPLFDNTRTSKFTQEFRLSGPIGRKLDGLLGAFYDHDSTPYSQTILATNPTSGAVVGKLAYVSFPTTYTEYAAFGDVTYHVTDQFDIQIGGRESKIEQTADHLSIGPYVNIVLQQTSPYTAPEERATSNTFTYLLTPRFKISPDLMVYARLASGYRPGGTNGISIGVPPDYQPDKTKNYEVGAKGDFLDHTLSLDASVFYIDWKNIQLGLVNPATGFAYTGNASAAKSQGVEWSVESRPITGLTIAAWVVWNDAVLKEGFPPNANGINGVAGDRLPFTSRFSGNASLNQEFSFSDRVIGFVGGALAYVGNREDRFTNSPQRQNLPAYTRTDLRAGLRYDSWTANFYVNNVADRRGLISTGTNAPSDFYYIQPRTVGLSLSRTF